MSNWIGPPWKEFCSRSGDRRSSRRGFRSTTAPTAARPGQPIRTGRPTPSGAHMLKAYATLVSLIAVAQDRLERDEKGATAVEYGLMVGLIAVVIIAAVTLLGEQLRDLFTSVTDELGGAGTAPAPAAG